MRAALRTAVLLVSVGVFGGALPTAARAQGNPDWHRAIPGFKIAGNLYYVGTADLAVYLIAGDYVKTFAVLNSLPVDLFLGAHGAYSIKG